MEQAEEHSRGQLQRQEQSDWAKILVRFSKAVDEVNRQVVLKHERNRQALKRYQHELELEFAEANAIQARTTRDLDTEKEYVDRKLEDLRLQDELLAKREQAEHRKMVQEYQDYLLEERAREKEEADKRSIERYWVTVQDKLEREVSHSHSPVAFKAPPSLKPVVVATSSVAQAKASLDSQFRQTKQLLNTSKVRQRVEEEKRAQKILERKREQAQEAAELRKLEQECSAKKSASMHIQQMLNPTRQQKLVPLNVVADRGRNIGESLTSQQLSRRAFVEDTIEYYQQQLLQETDEREKELERVQRSQSLTPTKSRPPAPGSPVPQQSKTPTLGRKERKRTTGTEKKRDGGVGGGASRAKVVSKLFKASTVPTPMTLLLASITADPNQKHIDLGTLEPPLSTQDLFYLRKALNAVTHINSIHFAKHVFNPEASYLIYETVVEASCVIQVRIDDAEFDPPSVKSDILQRVAANKRLIFNQRALELARSKQATLTEMEKKEAATLPMIRKRAHVAFEGLTDWSIQEESALRQTIMLFAHEDRSKLKVLRDTERRAIDRALAKQAREAAELEALLSEELSIREAITSLWNKLYWQTKFQATEGKKTVIRTARQRTKSLEKGREDFESEERGERLELRREEIRRRKELVEEWRGEKEEVDALDAERERLAAEERERIRRIEAAKQTEIERQKLAERKAERRMEQLLRRQELERESFFRQEAAERESNVGGDARKSMGELLDIYKELKYKLRRYQQRVKRAKERAAINITPLRVEVEPWLPKKWYANGTEVPMPLCSPATKVFPTTKYPSYMDPNRRGKQQRASLDEDEVSESEWLRQRNLLLGGTITVSLRGPGTPLSTSLQPPSSTPQSDPLAAPTAAGTVVLGEGDHVDLHNRDQLVLRRTDGSSPSEGEEGRDDVCATCSIHDQQTGVWYGTLVRYGPMNIVVHIARNDKLGCQGLLTLLLGSLVFHRGKNTVSVGEVHGLVEVQLYYLHCTEQNEYCPPQLQAPVAPSPDALFSAKMQRRPSTEATECGDSNETPGVVGRGTEEGIEDYISTHVSLPFKIHCIEPVLDVPFGPSPEEDTAAAAAADEDTQPAADPFSGRTFLRYRAAQGTISVCPKTLRVHMPKSVPGTATLEGAHVILDLGPAMDSSDYFGFSLTGACSGTESSVVIHGRKFAEVLAAETNAARKDAGHRPLKSRSRYVVRLLQGATKAQLEQFLFAVAFRNDKFADVDLSLRRVRITLFFPTALLYSSIEVGVQVLQEEESTHLDYGGPVCYHLNAMPHSPLLGGFVREAVIPCLVAPNSFLMDSIITDFQGGYFSVGLIGESEGFEFLRLVPELPPENWAEAEEKTGKPTTTAAAGKGKGKKGGAASPVRKRFLHISSDRGEVFYGDEQIGLLKQKSMTWLVVEFLPDVSVPLTAVQDLIRSIVFQNTTNYLPTCLSSNDEDNRRSIETVFTLGSGGVPFRSLRSVQLTAPLVQIDTSLESLDYKQNSGEILVGEGISVSGTVGWSGGIVFVEFATGFTADDLLTLAEDDDFHLVDESDAASMASVKSSQTTKSVRSVKSTSTVGTSRKGSILGVARQGSSALASSPSMSQILKRSPSCSLLRTSSIFQSTTYEEACSSSTIIIGGRKVGVVYVSARSILVQLNGTPPTESPSSPKTTGTNADDAESLPMGVPPAVAITNDDVQTILRHLSFENLSDNPTKELKKVIRITANDGLPHSTVAALEVNIIPSKPVLELQRLIAGPRLFRSLSVDDCDGFRLFSDVKVLGQDFFCVNGCTLTITLPTGGDPSGDQLGFLSMKGQRKHFPDAQYTFFVDRGELKLLKASQVTEEFLNEAESSMTESFSSPPASPKAADGASSPLVPSVGPSITLGDIAFDTPNPEGYSNIDLRFPSLHAVQRTLQRQGNESGGGKSKELHIQSHDAAESTPGVISLTLLEQIIHCFTFTYLLESKVKAGVRPYTLKISGRDSTEHSRCKLSLAVKGPLLWNPNIASEINLVFGTKAGAKAAKDGVPPPVVLLPKAVSSIDEKEKETISEGALTVEADPAACNAESGPELDRFDFTTGKKSEVKIENRNGRSALIWQPAVAGASALPSGAGSSKAPPAEVILGYVEERGGPKLTVSFDWRSPLTSIKHLTSLLRSLTFTSADPNGVERKVLVSLKTNLGTHVESVKVSFVRTTKVIKLATKLTGAVETVRLAPARVLCPEATLEVPEKTTVEPHNCTITASLRGAIDTDYLMLDPVAYPVDTLETEHGFTVITGSGPTPTAQTPVAATQKTPEPLLLSPAPSEGLPFGSQAATAAGTLRLEATRACSVTQVQQIIRSISAAFEYNPRDRHSKKAVDISVSVTGFALAKVSLMVDVLPSLLDIPFAVREGLLNLPNGAPGSASASGSEGGSPSAPPTTAAVVPLSGVVVPNVHFKGAATVSLVLELRPSDIDGVSNEEGVDGTVDGVKRQKLNALQLVLGSSLGFSIKQKEETKEIYIENRRVGTIRFENGQRLHVTLPKDRARPNNALLQRLLRSIEVQASKDSLGETEGLGGTAATAPVRSPAVSPVQPPLSTAATPDCILRIDTQDEERSLCFSFSANAVLGA